MLTLQAQQDTWLKQSPQQASTLDDDNKIFLKKGTTLPIINHEAIDELNSKASDNDYHVVVNLAEPQKGKRAWFCFQRHIALLQGEQLIFPAPEVDERKDNRAISTTPKFSGLPIRLPTGTTVYTDQPIITGGAFSWGEATHGATRIPTTAKQVENIIDLAKHLQRVRSQFGLPVTVTSWFRPEPFNSRVGGARRSQHLDGSAVDIVIGDLRGRDIAQGVVPWWPGGIGIYPGNRIWICHLDIGPKRRWGF